MGLKVSIIEESCELESQQGTVVVNRGCWNHNGEPPL